MNLAQLLTQKVTPLSEWKIDRAKTFTKAEYGKVTCTKCFECKPKDQFAQGKSQRSRTCLECDKAKRAYKKRSG